MNFDPGPLFYKMAKIFSDNYTEENKVIICNEGGTRSGKTWDAFHLIVAFCDHNRNANSDIYILRNTMVNCRDYTLKEFKNCMRVIGINTDNLTTSPKPNFKLWGNNIFFRGLDDENTSEGYPSDILFFNEALEMTKSKVDDLKMRCRKLIIQDWNPKYTVHWCFDQEGQPNIFFLYSTYKNNKHLQKAVITEIESYDPDNPDNVKNRTVNKFRHNVYALGIRCAREGLVFPDIIWIDKFPDEIERDFYGLDFGYTNNPSALCHIGVNKIDIYLENKLYIPTKDVNVLDSFLQHVLPKDKTCWCDSADPGMVSDLKKMGYQCFAAKKWAGCIVYRNDVLNRYNIHIVKDIDFRKEQENYRYKIINGIQLNEPEDSHNHLWSASGYAAQHELR